MIGSAPIFSKPCLSYQSSWGLSRGRLIKNYPRALTELDEEQIDLTKKVDDHEKEIKGLHEEEYTLTQKRLKVKEETNVVTDDLAVVRTKIPQLERKLAMYEAEVENVR